MPWCALCNKSFRSYGEYKSHLYYDHNVDDVDRFIDRSSRRENRGYPVKSVPRRYRRPY